MQRIYRLTKNSSFNYIYKKGESKSSKSLTLTFIKASNVKLGVSVSKKIGKSVVRSLVKRRIKESFRLFIPAITVKCNYVIIARQGVEERTFAEISKEIEGLLKRLKHLE